MGIEQIGLRGCINAFAAGFQKTGQAQKIPAIAGQGGGRQTMLGPQALEGGIDLGAGIGSNGVAGTGALADGIGFGTHAEKLSADAASPLC